MPWKQRGFDRYSVHLVNRPSGRSVATCTSGALPPGACGTAWQTNCASEASPHSNVPALRRAANSVVFAGAFGGRVTLYTSRRSDNARAQPAKPGPSPAKVNEQLQPPGKVKMHAARDYDNSEHLLSENMLGLGCELSYTRRRAGRIAGQSASRRLQPFRWSRQPPSCRRQSPARPYSST